MIKSILTKTTCGTMENRTQTPIVYPYSLAPFALAAITNMYPFPTRQHTTFTITRKKPRFILSYGIKRHGPTEKNFVMPSVAAKTDMLNVTIAWGSKGSIVLVAPDTEPNTTIRMMCT